MVKFYSQVRTFNCLSWRKAHPSSSAIESRKPLERDAVRKQWTFCSTTCKTFCVICKSWRGHFLRKLRQRESEGSPVFIFVVLHLFSLCISVNGRKHKKHTCTTGLPKVFQKVPPSLVTYLISFTHFTSTSTYETSLRKKRFLYFQFKFQTYRMLFNMLILPFIPYF